MQRCQSYIHGSCRSASCAGRRACLPDRWQAVIVPAPISRRRRSHPASLPDVMLATTALSEDPHGTAMIALSI
jgi:hypothetical protein